LGTRRAGRDYLIDTPQSPAQSEASCEDQDAKDNPENLVNPNE
jgi:hypothetical protein